MLCMLFLGWSERNDIWIWAWADKKQHSSPQSAQIFWISKQVLFCFQFAYTSYVNIFLPQPSHFEYNSCTWYLWKDFRLIGDFLFKVYFLRTSFPLKKTSRSHVYFLMVKPEVKTWMCHLQDLVINGSSMKVPPFFQPWAAPNWCGKILNPGKDLIRGPGIPSRFGTPFLSHRFLVVRNCLNIHPPKNQSKLVSFHHGYRFDFKGLSNASFHFSNPNSLDWFLTPRQLAWSFQHHLAHLSNGF